MAFKDFVQIQTDRETYDRLTELAQLTNRSRAGMLRHLVQSIEVVGTEVVWRNFVRRAEEPQACEATK